MVSTIIRTNHPGSIQSLVPLVYIINIRTGVHIKLKDFAYQKKSLER